MIMQLWDVIVVFILGAAALGLYLSQTDASTVEFLFPAELTMPVLMSSEGRILDQGILGQEIIISTTINSSIENVQPYVAIYEVRGSDGITVELEWINGTLDPNSSKEIQFSWIPERAGQYEARIFVLTSMQNPELLSGMVERTFTVSEASLPTVELDLPLAKTVHDTETLVVPAQVKTFVIYMANEFHENWKGEAHKLITNKNGYTVPTTLVIHNGSAVAFHMADGPWDTHHTYVLKVIDKQTDKVTWKSALMGYPTISELSSDSGTVTLPVGEYEVEAFLRGEEKVRTKPITIEVLSTPAQPSNVTVGSFYSPQKPVMKPNDNDGEVHYGQLEYYRQEFPQKGLTIESTHDFHFASCAYYDKGATELCVDDGAEPGEYYWADNKTPDHTLILWSSTMSYEEVATALDELTWANVYI